jgi:hypothetical protein
MLADDNRAPKSRSQPGTIQVESSRWGWRRDDLQDDQDGSGDMPRRMVDVEGRVLEATKVSALGFQMADWRDGRWSRGGRAPQQTCGEGSGSVPAAAAGLRPDCGAQATSQHGRPGGPRLECTGSRRFAGDVGQIGENVQREFIREVTDWGAAAVRRRDTSTLRWWAELRF